MAEQIRVLVPSPSAFTFDLRPTHGGGLAARRRQVRMMLACAAIAVVSLGLSWWMKANPIWSSPAEFEEYGAPLVGGLIFLAIGAAAFFAFARGVEIDTRNKRVVFERRRFWRATNEEIPLTDATLVVAPVHTEMNFKGMMIRWSGHLLYVRGGEQSFALLAHEDQQRVLEKAGKLSRETGLTITTEAETVTGVDC